MAKTTSEKRPAQGKRPVKVLAKNRKARHDFHLLEILPARRDL
jgi:hypothetical protein